MLNRSECFGIVMSRIVNKKKTVKKVVSFKHLIWDILSRKMIFPKKRKFGLVHLSVKVVLTGPDTPLAEEC